MMKLNKDVTKADIVTAKQEIAESLEKSSKVKEELNTERTVRRLSSKAYSLIIIISVIVGAFLFVPIVKSLLDYEEPVPATERALEWVK